MSTESAWGEADRPTSGVEHCGWDIYRTDALKVLRFACVSVKHFGVYTHWLKGRTQPHLKENCPGCEAGKDLRWYGFLLGLLYPNKRKIIFEFTAGSSESVNKCFDELGNLRGCIFQASRPRGKDNSRVQVTLMDSRCNPADLVPDEPIRPLLAKIWGCEIEGGTLHGGEDIRLASEDLLVQAGLRNHVVRPSEVHLDDLGEVRGVKQRAADLPGQLNMLSQNGRQ